MKRWEAKISLQPTVCSICSENHPIEKCQILTEVKHIADSKPPTQARLSIPSTLGIRDTLDGVAVVAKAPLCRGTQFGPFKAQLIDMPPLSGFILQIFHDNDIPGSYLETNNEHKCNWMCLVAPAENSSEQNLVAYQVDQKIYYSVTKNTNVGDELKVWYAPFYATKLKKSLLPPGDSEEILQSAIEDYNNTPTNLKRKSKLKNHCIPSSDPIVNDLTPKQLGAKVTKDQWPCQRCCAVEKTIPGYARHLMIHLQEDMKLALRLEKNNQNNNEGYALMKTDSGEPPGSGISHPVTGKNLQPQFNNLNDDSLKNDKSMEKLGWDNSLDKSLLSVLDSKRADTPPTTLAIEDKVTDEKIIDNSTLNSVNVNILDFDDLNISNLDKTVSLNNLFSLDNDLFINYNSEESRHSSTKKSSSGVDGKQDKLDFDFKSTSSLIDLNCSNLEYLINDIPSNKRDNVDSFSQDLLNMLNEKPMFNNEPECDAIKVISSIPSSVESNLPMFGGDSIVTSVPRSTLEQNAAVAVPTHLMNTHSQQIVTDGASDYTCEICMHEFKNARYLFRHLRLHLGEFTCTKCFRAFSRKQTLDDHLCKVFICQKCDQKFVFASHFQKHERWHVRTERLEHMKKAKENANNDEGLCSICNERFSSKVKLRKHCKNVHTVDTRDDAEKRTCICSVCGNTYKDVKSLNIHFKQHGEPQFECQICDKKFYRKSTLRKHIVGIHGLIRFQCGQCPSSFTTEYAHQLHLKSLHSVPSPFKCKFCGKVLNRKINLEKHEKSHLEQKLGCSECNRVFQTAEGFEKHKKMHIQRKCFTCSQCSQVFVGSKKLRLHFKEAHFGPYTCSFCFMSIKKISCLKKHLECRHKDKLNEWNVPGYFDSLKGLTADKNKNLNESSIIGESSNSLTGIPDDQMAFSSLDYMKSIPKQQVPCSVNDLEPATFSNDGCLSDPVSINFDIDNSIGLGIFGSDTNNAIISDVISKKDENIYGNSSLLNIDQFNLLKQSCDVPMINGNKSSVQQFNILKESNQDFSKSDVLNIMIDANQLYSNSISDSSTLGLNSLNSLGGEILWTLSDLPGIGSNHNITQSLPVSDAGVQSEAASNNGNMLLYVVEPSCTEIATNNSELVLF